MSIFAYEITYTNGATEVVCAIGDPTETYENVLDVKTLGIAIH